MIDTEMFHIFIPILTFCTFLCIHVFLMRKNYNIGYANSIIISFIIGILIILFGNFVITMISNASVSDKIGYGILNSIIFTLFVFCYCVFTTLGISSLRIRMLIEIKKSGMDGLTEQMLLEFYNAYQIIKARIARLKKNGQIKKINGKYYMNKHFILIIAYTFLFFRHIVFGKNKGF